MPHVIVTGGPGAEQTTCSQRSPAWATPPAKARRAPSSPSASSASSRTAAP